LEVDAGIGFFPYITWYMLCTDETVRGNESYDGHEGPEVNAVSAQASAKV
jgi:hypothetical protein